MKNLYFNFTKSRLRLFLVFVLSIFSVLSQAHASHVRDGKLSYRWLGGNSYEIRVDAYAEPGGTAFIPFVSNLEARSTACDTAIYGDIDSVATNLFAPPLPIAGNCQSVIFGANRLYVYMDTLELPPCADWMITAELGCCRHQNSYSNFQGPFIFKAHLDNWSFKHNSSPKGLESNAYIACYGGSDTLRAQYVDPDGDSLHFSWEYPYDESRFYSNFTWRPWNTLGSSFPKVSLDPVTGEIAFSGGFNAAEYTLGIRIGEYRAGRFVGRSSRIINLIVIPCPSTNQLPRISEPLSVSGANFSGLNTLEMCLGDSLNLTFSASDSDTGQSLIVRDSIALPGMNMLVSGPGNQKQIQIGWRAPSVPGVYQLGLAAYDDHCPWSGYGWAGLCVRVTNSIEIAGEDTLIVCADTPLLLSVQGGTNHVWRVIQGDPQSIQPTGNPAIVNVNPTVTTSYEVSGNLSCGSRVADTVVVMPHPGFSLQLNGLGPVCKGDSLRLFAQVTGTRAATFGYSWTFLSETIQRGKPAFTFAPQASTDLIFTAQEYPSGCSFSDTIAVDVKGTFAPIGIAASDSALCPQEDSINLVLQRNKTGSCANYTVTSTPFNLKTVNISTSQIIGLGLQQISNAIPLGFPFEFDCQPQSEFYLGSNGWVYFEQTTYVDTGGVLIPSPSPPNKGVALLGANFIMNPFAANFATYSVEGVAPNRMGIVNLQNVQSIGNGSTSNVAQLHLYEGSNIMEIHISRANTGIPTTVGVETGGGLSGVAAPGRNAQLFTIAAGQEEAWRFIDRAVISNNELVTWDEPGAGSGVLSQSDSLLVGRDSVNTYRVVLQDTVFGCSDTAYQTIYTVAPDTLIARANKSFVRWGFSDTVMLSARFTSGDTARTSIRWATPPGTRATILRPSAYQTMVVTNGRPTNPFQFVIEVNRHGCLFIDTVDVQVGYIFKNAELFIADTGCVYLPELLFINPGGGVSLGPLMINWQLPGDSTKTGPSIPGFTFSNPGMNQVKVCLIDPVFSDTLCLVDSIYIKPRCWDTVRLDSIIIPDTVCMNTPFPIEVFTSNSQSPSIFLRGDMGDGREIPLFAFNQVSYAQSGNFTIGVCLYDTVHGDTFCLNKAIYCKRRCFPLAQLDSTNLNTSSLCLYSNYVWQAYVSGGSGDFLYRWRLEGRGEATGNPFYHSTQLGDSILTLYVIDRQSLDTITYRHVFTQIGYCADTVRGRLFADINRNTVFDAGDIPLAYTPVYFNHDASFHFSDETGVFTYISSPGERAFDIAAGPSLQGFVQTLPINQTGHSGLFEHRGTVYNADFIYRAIPATVDLSLTGTMNDPRLTSRHMVNIQWNNRGNSPSPASLQLIYDSAMVYQSYSGNVSNPTHNRGQRSLTWTLPDVGAMEPAQSLTAFFSPKNNLNPGTAINHQISIAPSGGAQDIEISNNCLNLVDTMNATISSMRKVADPPFKIKGDDWVYFSIRFQNTDSNTISTVQIRDTLDHNFDVFSRSIPKLG